jgi:hypothetical protein
MTVSYAASGTTAITTLTVVAVGTGYKEGDTLTIAAANCGTGACASDIVITLTAGDLAAANLASCISANALNIWSHCTSCPSKCVASATYVSATPTTFAAGADITGANCGAAKNADCTIKANCKHANVGGVWSGSFRQLLGAAPTANSRGAVKTSADADETSAVCATQCDEDEQVDITGTASCFPDLSTSTASEDAPVAGAASADAEAACLTKADYTFHPKCVACDAGKIRGSRDFPHISGETVCYDHKCPAGYAINGKRCLKCAPGTTLVRALSVAGTGGDETCAITLCAKDFAVKSHVCTACPAGTSISYSGTNGEGVATQAGDASLADTTCHATVCNVDYHVSDIGAGVLRCRKCPAWQTRPAGDSTGGLPTTVTACTDRTCALNEYVQADADQTCATCPAWEAPNAAAQARGTTKAASAVKCVEVRCATTEKVVITGTCATKDGGADRTASDDCGADNQQPCATKAACEGSAAAPATWTKTGAKCTACATGTAGTVADVGLSLSATQASTECVELANVGYSAIPLCLADFYVKNHVCTACATGKIRAAGDDPNSHVDTVCTNSVKPVAHGDGAEPHDTLCAADEHVQNFACTKCAPGTTNNAGDDPHHFDTVCQKVLCKVNEYVKEHVCTPCSTAHGHKMNTAGDDASGPDTMCY